MGHREERKEELEKNKYLWMRKQLSVDWGFGMRGETKVQKVDL